MASTMAISRKVILQIGLLVGGVQPAQAAASTSPGAKARSFPTRTTLRQSPQAPATAAYHRSPAAIEATAEAAQAKKKFRSLTTTFHSFFPTTKKRERWLGTCAGDSCKAGAYQASRFNARRSGVLNDSRNVRKRCS